MTIERQRRINPFASILKTRAIRNNESTARDFYIDSSDSTNFEPDPAFVEQMISLEYTLWNEKKEPDSITEQLSDPIRRAFIGIKIPSSEESRGAIEAEIVQTVSDTFASFADPETATNFNTWFNSRINGQHRQQACYFLQTLIHYATFLDFRSYKQITRTDEGQTTLLPLDTLLTCVADLNGTDKGINQAHALMWAQYSNILNANPLMLDYEMNEPHPDAAHLGTALLAWVDQPIKAKGMSLEQRLHAILNYLEMYEAENKERFFEFLERKYGKANIDVQKVKSRAIDHNLIKAPKAESDAVIESGLRQIVETDKVDAAEINYKDLIPPNTETVLFVYRTGAHGPGHIGHLYTDEVAEKLMEEMMATNPGLYCQLVLAPTKEPQKLTHKTAKTAGQIGGINERVECLFGLTRNLKRTYITTRLQEEFPDDPMKRIATIQERAIASMKKSLGVDKLPFSVRFVRVFGIDKILNLQQNPTACPVREPSEEYLGPAIVKVRRKYLPDTIKYLDTIREKYPKAVIILTPDTPKGSSSEAIHRQDYTYFPLVELAIGNGNWDLEKIREREASNQVEDEHINSATIIYLNLRNKILQGQISVS